MARIFLIVLDSVGIGQAEDASAFGDCGANTLGNISQKVGLSMPNMQLLGLGNIAPIATIPPVFAPTAYYTYMKPVSAGKDSIAGHWEMMGIVLKNSFNNFCENGFPSDLITLIEQATRRQVLGNKAASGLQIIRELAETQIKTGGLIIYTSIDSTLQIAAHESFIPLSELYEICSKIRKWTLDNPQWQVARVIARPYIGTKGNYIRTENRHDYALSPFEPTVLDALHKNNIFTLGIGKINDLFNGVGIRKSIKTKDNADGIQKIIDTIQNTNFSGFCFTNLVDFDSLYGHPRNPQGYKEALEYFDTRLPEVLNALLPEDILILTADHGNDPTFKGNDHTRENVPLLIYSKRFTQRKKIIARKSFADLGRTIAHIYNIPFEKGKSFLPDLR